jgi:hypothetical protein
MDWGLSDAALLSLRRPLRVNQVPEAELIAQGYLTQTERKRPRLIEVT